METISPPYLPLKIKYSSFKSSNSKIVPVNSHSLIKSCEIEEQNKPLCFILFNIKKTHETVEFFNFASAIKVSVTRISDSDCNSVIFFLTRFGFLTLRTLSFDLLLALLLLLLQIYYT